MEASKKPVNRKNLYYIFGGIAALALIGFAIWKFSSPKSINAHNVAFAQYVEGYTTGVVSKDSPIRILLASQVGTVQEVGEEDKRNLFTLSPSVKGKVYWTDARTVEFIPDEPLTPGETYHVSFDLKKIIDVSQELSSFSFGFKVIEPSYNIELDGLKAQTNSSLELMKLTGNIQLADNELAEDVEKVVTVSYQQGKPAIKWEHHPETKSAKFTIDSIKRGSNEQTLSIQWDGRPIKANKKEGKEIAVPAKGVFKVLDVKPINDPEQYVLVQFSDPILVAQNLEGLISISEQLNVRYTIDGSEVKVYANEALEGNYTVVVNEGIENITSKKLGTAYTSNIHFDNNMPSVSIPGQGTILPGSGKITMPFEAVNLRAVDVTIIKIYENNIPQYYQNNYDDRGELRRVGKPLVQKTIALDDDKSLNLRRKNRFALDIDELIKAEPGAIYRVRIGFRQEYSVFSCEGIAVPDGEDNEYYDDYGYYYQGSSDVDGDGEFWSRYDNYYPANYRWDQRMNPCHSSYYTTDRWATRDMLASNIGLIAKAGNDNSLVTVTTSILTAQPMQGVEIKVLDYQQQVIQVGTTDADGIARLETPRKPFLLVASKNDERGYLKLDDGSALPLSRFDVGGDVIQKGIKGFIYGERGVWRPGDSIFVSFIMENQSASLPDNHPVTFELVNSRGQLSKRIVETKNVNGFYTFKTATESTAPTGNWLAKVSVGGAVFQKTLKIETVMPNRLKIDLGFDGTKVLTQGGNNSVSLSARWLFGADVQNLKARVEANTTAVRTTFENFKNHQFDDPTRSYYPEAVVLFDGTLDGAGKATFSVDGVQPNQAPGMLRVNFTTRVFEPGGNFSIDQLSMPYSPYNNYVGVSLPQGDRLSGMLLTDKDHPVSIVGVSPDGKKNTGTRKVQVEFYKIRWSWWWSQEGENLGNFTQDKYNQLIKKEVIDLKNGEAKWNIRVNYPDWGRYLVRVVDLESGHATGKTVYIDWPGWAQREQKNNPTEASMLSFTSDKERYEVGDNVNLTIPSSAGGRGLVSIENGSRILKTWWIDTEQGQTNFKFKVEEEMAPNVFVNVTLLQPHAQTANDLPIRMYGVIPLLVENPKTVLQPNIKIAETLRPETKNSITVSESNGKAMTYTIAIVDEGLLDLTRFQTPDPHRSFYAREALGVKSWDLFDKVIGAWGGDLERILSIGGDGDINRNVNPAKANRFTPVVKFLGPFTLGKGSSKTHEFTLPQYVGSVRAMVIAGQDGAYGFAEKAVAVKKPLMLLATLPRVIGPDETFTLPLTVFAMENSIKQVDLEVTASDGLTATNAKQQLSFTQQGEKLAYVNIRAGHDTGIGKIKAIAKSGKETAVYEVEIDIRNPNPFITSVDRQEVAAGGKWEQAIKPLGPGNNNTTLIEVSSLPPINLSDRLSYLIRYPHGCLEQVTSSVFPQLLLDKLIPLSEKQLAQVDHHIKLGINRVRGYQLTSGGFGYWQGAREADEWSTNYVGHFLLEAKAKGYSLPAGVLDGWTRFQRQKAQAWAPNQYNWRGGDLLQAYRLYLLALAKSPDIGAMNRLKEFQYLSDEAAWRLAAAYQLAGQRVVANQLIKGRSTEIEEYKTAGYTFGSSLRDKSMILETLNIMGLEQQGEKLLLSVANQLGNNSWYSTQTTAFALLAVAKYGDNEKGENKFSYTLNGKSTNITSKHYLHRIELDKPNADNQLSIQNSSGKKLYIRAIREGQLPPGQNPPLTNNPQLLTMAVSYVDNSGAVIRPDTLKQGTDFIAVVTLKNTGSIGTYDQMALTQIFPSGWEIINTRLNDNESAWRSSPSTYKDIRDDRVLTYFNIRQQETLTYRVLLNASYIGKYFLPSVSAEAMYDNRIQALTTGKWVEVVE